MRSIKFFLIISSALLHFYSCNFKPVAEELPISVISNLNLLQENPQFVMYLNFKNMRHTDFWKKNISDSLLNAEKTFGSLLNTFKEATGASVSDGIDELYYSNSWFGENAIVLKGIFNKEKLNTFIESDSLFSVTTLSNGTNIFIRNDIGLYFYFRDDFTICASNYLKQIDVMISVKDTAKSGLLLNKEVISTVENIIYKDNVWMVSTEKIFIKGIFQNLIESTSDDVMNNADTLSGNADTLSAVIDSLRLNEKLSIENLYKKLSSVSFSSKMDSDMKFLIQGMCEDEKSADYLKNIISGLITVGKLNSSGQKNSGMINFLNQIKIEKYDNSVFVEIFIDEKLLSEIKKMSIMNNPEFN